MLLAEWQVREVFWAVFWFTGFFVWVWLVTAVFVEIFNV